MFIKCVLEFAFCKRKGSTFYKPSITGDPEGAFTRGKSSERLVVYKEAGGLLLGFSSQNWTLD